MTARTRRLLCLLTVRMCIKHVFLKLWLKSLCSNINPEFLADADAIDTGITVHELIRLKL